MEIKNIVLFVEEESKKLFSLLETQPTRVEDAELEDRFFDAVSSIDPKYSGLTKAVYQIAYDQHLDEPRIVVDYSGEMEIVCESKIQESMPSIYEELQSIKEDITKKMNGYGA